jgi:mono/diheme cytochrome c family protein
MGVLTYKGATAKEALGAELLAEVPHWVKAEQLPQAAVPGAKLFATSGCLNCHTYLGIGGALLGAPDLSAEGSKNKGITFQVAHLKCPSCVNKGSPMPSFVDFGDANLHRLAVFLEASKGPH